MRRKEFSILEKHGQDALDFMTKMNYGNLALSIQHEYPTIVPLNYVYLNEAIYFHGSRVGEKMDLLETQCRATFSITEEYAIIPSYIDDPYFACPATAFFKSVIVYGDICVVDDEQEKHEALDALMRKLQPEGGYAPITYEDESYRKRVKTTAVIRLSIKDLSAKFKFGQNWKQDKHDKVKAHLSERNKGLDKETIQLMERYCPFHQAKE